MENFNSLKYIQTLARDIPSDNIAALLSKAAEDFDRWKRALQKIAHQYPCETADDMSRLAKETLGEMHYNLDS